MKNVASTKEMWCDKEKDYLANCEASCIVRPMLRSSGLTIWISWVLLNLRKLKSAWRQPLVPTTPIGTHCFAKQLPNIIHHMLYTRLHIFSVNQTIMLEKVSHSVIDDHCRLPFCIFQDQKLNQDNIFSVVSRIFFIKFVLQIDFHFVHLIRMSAKFHIHILRSKNWRCMTSLSAIFLPGQILAM